MPCSPSPDVISPDIILAAMAVMVVAALALAASVLALALLHRARRARIAPDAFASAPETAGWDDHPDVLAAMRRTAGAPGR